MSPPSPLGDQPYPSRQAVAAELTALEGRFGSAVPAILDRAFQLELLASTLDDERLQVRARLLQAVMHRRNGDIALAEQMGGQAEAWAREHDDRPLLTRSREVMSAIRKYQGRENQDRGDLGRGNPG